MNLLLLQDSHILNSHQARITGNQHEHVLKVHRANVGDSLRVGMLDGQIGQATITELNKEHLEITFQLYHEPPQPLPVTLVIALPRPQMLKRILQTVATMGVKHLIFIHSQRVEKSFWQTPELNEDKVRKQILLGLEQGVDTRLPTIEYRHRFKHFVEDELPALCYNRRALVAHPGVELGCPTQSQEQTLLVIGPEGGFVQNEVDMLVAAGCQAFHLGARILKVETAVPVLLGKLFP